jgi:hypothetical protein
MPWACAITISVSGWHAVCLDVVNARTQSLIRRPLICLLLCLFAISVSSAQVLSDLAIPESELNAPWHRLREVLATVDAARVGEPQIKLALRRLQESLGPTQTGFENITYGLASKMEFAYEAAERSRDLGALLRENETAIKELVDALAIVHRADVQALLRSVETLRQWLIETQRLERDITQTIGSGSKNQIVALATMWWGASERIGEARAVIELLHAAKENL